MTETKLTFLQAVLERTIGNLNRFKPLNHRIKSVGGVHMDVLSLLVEVIFVVECTD